MVGGLALSEPASEVQEPPAKLGGILRQLGPGLIMAAGIVGSGELIAATLTGAKAGFIFLGLIFLAALSNASHRWRLPDTQLCGVKPL